MEREDAIAALQQDQRGRDAARTGTRWAPRTLLAWGLVTLVTEPAMALAGFPWLFVPLGVLLIFLTWLVVYANRQRVTARGFGWRYSIVVVLASAILHPAYLAVVLAADLRDPYIAIPLGWVVAIPLFVGAYIESRQQ